MNQVVLDDGEHEKRKVLHETLYAPFGKRVLASMVDTLVFIPIYCISDYNYNSWKLFSLDLFLTIFIPVVYRIVMEWKYGATIGKMVLKLRVVNYQLKPISFIQSVKRFSIYFLTYSFAVISSIFLFYHPEFYQVSGDEMDFLFETDVYLICLAGMVLPNTITAIFVLIADKKQALHDFIAQTYCVNQSDWQYLQQIDEILTTGTVKK
jgi:uncharacterized RDD family membrane protein YckC